MRALKLAWWLILAVAFYAVATYAGLPPQIQTVTFKLGNATVAAFLGFIMWESTSQFMADSEFDQLAQSILIGAVVLAVSLGL